MVESVSYAHDLRFISILDDEVPHGADPAFEHLLVTYASETNKTGWWYSRPAGVRTKSLVEGLARPLTTSF